MDDIRKGVCPLCKHNEIVVATPREPTPLAMTFARQAQFDAWRERPVETERPALHKPLGMLSIHACGRCGYAQLFVENISEVSIGKVYNTRVIKGPAHEGPYR
jgi:hypothetical protein